MQTIKELQADHGVKSLDSLNATEQDLLAVALGSCKSALAHPQECRPF